MEHTDGKRKITPSIPEKFISILQLQERWINEKERKRKEEEEEEERRRKQQAEERQRIEEDLKKVEVEGKREDIDEKRLNRSNRKHCGRNSKKKEPIDGGEARCAEEEETAAIGSERGEVAAPRDEGLPKSKRRFRKRYKKKYKDVAAVKEDAVDECGSIAPPEYVVTEYNTPAKDSIWVYRKKGENATGKKSVTVDATAIETQFEDLSIKRGETKNLKAQARSSNRNRLSQSHDLHPQRVAVEKDVVECGTENHTPAKDGIRVSRKKGEKATGKIIVESREKAVTDVATATETQFEDLTIKRGETKNLKAKTRSSHRNRLNQRRDLQPQCVAVEAVVVECGAENHASVKDGIRVSRKKGEKATGKTSSGSREKAVMDVATAIETQSEDLSIKSGETKNLKAQTRSSNRNRPNQRHDSTMMWVKKEQNERDGDGIGNGV